MKKGSTLLFAGLILMFSSGTVKAIVWTDTVKLGQLLCGQGTFTWTHSMPLNFEAPEDTVNSATLDIYASMVNGDNDIINVGDIDEVLTNSITTIWKYVEIEFCGITYKIKVPRFIDTHTSIDLVDIFMEWPSGQDLSVSLDYNDNFLKLHCSKFVLDYNEVNLPDGSTPVVPEPSSMFLLGTGILSLLSCRKRNKN